MAENEPRIHDRWLVRADGHGTDRLEVLERHTENALYVLSGYIPGFDVERWRSGSEGHATVGRYGRKMTGKLYAPWMERTLAFGQQVRSSALRNKRGAGVSGYDAIFKIIKLCYNIFITSRAYA